MSLPMARIGDMGVGIGLCPIPIPQVGMIVSGSGPVSGAYLPQAFTTCIIVAGCQIAVGMIVSGSATATAGPLGMTRMSDAFVGTFTGSIIGGAGTALCGG